MPDFYAPPDSSNSGGNNPISTMSALLGLKQRQQEIKKNDLEISHAGAALQGQASENLSLQAKAQGDTQDMQERQGIQKLMQTGVDDQGQSIMDPTTKQPDIAKAAAAIGRIAPRSGQTYIQNMIKTHTDRVGLERATQELDVNNRAALQGIAQSAIGTGAGSKELNAQIDQYTGQHPEAKSAGELLKNLTPHLDTVKDPKQRTSVINGISSAMQGGQSVQTQPTNENVNTGGQTVLGTRGPAVAGGGFNQTGAVTNTPAPGYMQGPNGSIIKADSGGLSSPPVAGGPSAPAAPANKLQSIPRPGINAPAAEQQKYKDITEQGTKEINNVSNAANDPQNGTQVTRYRNRQILDLADKGASTGPGKDLWNHIASQLPGKSGDAYQTIGHYLAQNSSAIAAKMGVPNTNMGAETAAAAGGNVSQNPGAIKEITKVNDAVNTAFDMYNKGLAKATQNGANTDKLPAFKQAFGQNFDLNVLRYDDAVRRGDKTEINDLAKKLGPDGLKQLGAKRKVLHSLSDTGDLP